MKCLKGFYSAFEFKSLKSEAVQRAVFFMEMEMMNKLILFAVFFSAMILQGAERYALVVGNGNYSFSPLANPLNDAEDMAEALTERGFSVTLITDGSRREILSAVNRLKEEADPGATLLFYYAGHGVQVEGKNYLLPVGGEIVSEEDALFEGIQLDHILAKFGASESSRNIFILDACRNNPFESQDRSLSRGLAVSPRVLSDSIVIYATSPGKSAADGKGRNGIFTEALLNHIHTQGLELTGLLKKVTRDVRDRTSGEQIPWSNSSLVSDFYFHPSAVIKQRTSTLQVQVPGRGRISLNGKEAALSHDADFFTFDSLTSGEYRVLYEGDTFHEEKTVLLTEGDSLVLKFSEPENISKNGVNMVPVYTQGILRFYISSEEVSQKLWSSVMETNPSFFKGEDLPVEQVSWYKAVEFCNRLSEKEGLEPVYTIKEEEVLCDFSRSGYRLPLAREWHTARNQGREKSDTSHNNNSFSSIVLSGEGLRSIGGGIWSWLTYKAPEESAVSTDKSTSTLPVLSGEKDVLGLRFMMGNVWEWCWDAEGSDRILLGGSWDSDKKYLEKPLSVAGNPDAAGSGIGFRVVRSH